MEGNEGGGENPPLFKRPRPGVEPTSDGGDGGGGERANEQYKPYFKPNYKRQYPENSTKSEFKVFVEHLNPKDRLGNKSPIYLNHIFTTDIKGVMAIQRLNANKIAVVFKQYNTANNFLNNSAFLEKHSMRAYIPATQIEKTGIIRFVPANISNKDLYTKLNSIYEIIAVRRFTKKVGHERVPLQTVSITFLSNELPDDVQYDLFSYRVFKYVPPLQQCFKCFKFNHSAKICNGKQRCSICSGEHIYTQCDNPNELKCANCSGQHLAISKLCPIKMSKLIEKQNEIKNNTYANVTKTNIPETNEYPPLPMPQHQQPKQLVNNPPVQSVNNPVQNVNTSPSVNKKNVNRRKSAAPQAENAHYAQVQSMDLKAQILASSDVLSALVRTLVELGNNADPNAVITTASIQDRLIKNLSSST